ncbi:MAG TPA: MFS transporter [Vicinamibacteria bacterium]|nr:MFS transporter [Vicinamibacteria bacterium]
MPEPWQRNQYVTVATVFVVFTGFAFVLPFLPLFVRELGVVDAEKAALWAGVLIGVAPLLAGLLAPVWGRLADRYGHKAMALRALAAYVVLLALSAHVTNVGQLLALRIGVGLFGGIGPLGLAMATAHAPRDQTGRAVGLVQAAQILSAAVGPFVGGALADIVGFRATFLVTACACGFAFLLVLLLYDERSRPGAEASAGRHARFADALRLPGVGGLLAILFLVNFIGRSFTPILPMQLAELGVPASRLSLTTGLLISLYSIAAALSAAGLGRMSRLYPPSRLLVLSLAGGAVTVLPMGLVERFLPMLLCAVLLGLASGGALTLCYTIGGLAVPQESRGSAFGFFSAAALFGGALSPSVAGLLAHLGLRSIYWVNAALFVLLAIAVALRHAPRPATIRGTERA